MLNGVQRGTLVSGLDWITTNDSNFTLASAKIQKERDEVRAIADDPMLFRGNKVNLFNTRLTVLKEHLEAWIGEEREHALEVGAFVTGSGTSSGMLFGPIQSQAAAALGVSDYWMVALNALGVAAGKMISPQTLAIGLAAVLVRGKDAELLGAVLPYAAGVLVLMSAIAMLGQGLPL